MKRILQFMISILSLAGVLSAQDVMYNFDPSADFSKYKTYRWERHPKSMDIDDLTLNQLSKGFEAALATKGLTKTDAPNADLIIVFQVALKQEKEINTYSSDFGYGPGWRGGWYGGMGSSMTTGTTSTIHIGNVVLDMYDREAKKLVWRGMASKTIDEKAKPEKRQKNIDKAATKMLKKYPPKVKS